MSSDDGFLWGEEMVAGRLGVARGDIKKARVEGLEIDVHFVNRRGKGIFYSEAGFRLLVGLLGLEMDEAGTVVKKGAEGGADGVLEGRVVRIYPNRASMLLVRLEGGGTAPVRVRSNRKFVIGQRLPLVPWQAYSPVLRLACREPVRRGKISWDWEVEKGAEGGSE